MQTCKLLCQVVYFRYTEKSNLQHYKFKWRKFNIQLLKKIFNTWEEVTLFSTPVPLLKKTLGRTLLTCSVQHSDWIIHYCKFCIAVPSFGKKLKVFIFEVFQAYEKGIRGIMVWVTGNVVDTVPITYIYMKSYF